MLKSKRISIIMIVVLGLFFTLQSGSCNNTYSKSNRLKFKTKNVEVEKTDGIANVLSLQNVFRQIAKSTIPATVSISVESEVTVRNPMGDMFNDPFFRNDPNFKRFFGNPGGEQKRKIQAQGSGVIFTKNGYIFSNHHVVDKATKIIITLADNRTFEAKLVGSDPETDIAILKIEADNLPYAALGESSEIEVGDLVVAIGNPFGLAGTFTFGTVSAVGRPGMQSGFQRFIQTDTVVNPGNSGGPLLNIRGQVIGINTAIHSRTGGYMGISFAVPIDIAKNIAHQIVENGKVVRGYLGITPGPLDEATRKALKLNANEGLVISQVQDDSPAEKSGLKAGDIVIKVNGKTVNQPAKLQTIIGGLQPGAKVKIEYLRNNERKTTTVTLARRPVGEEWSRNNPTKKDKDTDSEGKDIESSVEFLGATFENPGKNYLEKNRAKYGVVVSAVARDSMFVNTLRRGEIVAGVNGNTIKTLADMKKFAKKNKGKRAFTFLIIRNGFMFYRGVEK